MLYFLPELSDQEVSSSEVSHSATSGTRQGASRDLIMGRVNLSAPRAQCHLWGLISLTLTYLLLEVLPHTPQGLKPGPTSCLAGQDSGRVGRRRGVEPLLGSMSDDSEREVHRPTQVH